MKKYLIIHPTDPTTVCLKKVYEHLTDKTVITGGISKSELPELIKNHEQVIMCGHGSPSGLFSCWLFGPDSLVIDDSMVEYFRKKTNIFIWCHADQFVKRNGLNGFCTQMFISEIQEALYYGFEYTGDLGIIIDESNYVFTESVGRHIKEPIDVLYYMVLKEYGELARTNPIASFNFKRLLLILQPDFVLDKTRFVIHD